MIDKLLMSDKLFGLYSISKFEIFHVLHDKVALLSPRSSEHGTRNRCQSCFRKV